MNKVLADQIVPSGQTLQLVQGDITAETTDAIVNAANERLQHGAGVAGAILRRGGPDIQRESDEWVKTHGPISHAAPAWTSGGTLPCRYVIHAVGPVWGDGDEDAKLRATVTGSLRLADELRVKSISVPAISTGIFGFPKERAADIILKSIQEYFGGKADSGIKLVRLVLYDQATIPPFRKRGMITSAQNPKLKLARLLMGRPKQRHAAKAFVAEGVRLVEEALAVGWPFRFVLHSEGLSERGNVLIKKLKAKGVDCEPAAESLLQPLGDTETSQGILAVLDHSPLSIPHDLSFVLIPDQIRDPGNLGTLLRTAAAARVQAVFLPPETTDAFAPKVVRAGMGAHFRLPMLSLSWDEVHARTRGLKVYLAEMEGALSCWEVDFRLPLVLIVGGEAEGTSQSARDLASQQVYIPMPGGSESLNAAVAGAILMFEIVRQRENLPRGEHDAKPVLE